MTGTIPTKTASDVTADGPLVAVPPGYYPQAVNKTVSDPDLVPGNIKAGVEIFGVTGTYEGEAPASSWTVTFNQGTPNGYWQYFNVTVGNGALIDGMVRTFTEEIVPVKMILNTRYYQLKAALYFNDTPIINISGGDYAAGKEFETTFYVPSYSGKTITFRVDTIQ